MATLGYAFYSVGLADSFVGLAHHDNDGTHSTFPFNRFRGTDCINHPSYPHDVAGRRLLARSVGLLHDCCRYRDLESTTYQHPARLVWRWWCIWKTSGAQCVAWHPTIYLLDIRIAHPYALSAIAKVGQHPPQYTFYRRERKYL